MFSYRKSLKQCYLTDLTDNGSASKHKFIKYSDAWLRQISCNGCEDSNQLTNRLSPVERYLFWTWHQHKTLIYIPINNFYSKTFILRSEKTQGKTVKYLMSWRVLCSVFFTFKFCDKVKKDLLCRVHISTFMIGQIRQKVLWLVVYFYCYTAYYTVCDSIQICCRVCRILRRVFVALSTINVFWKPNSSRQARKTGVLLSGSSFHWYDTSNDILTLF